VMSMGVLLGCTGMLVGCGEAGPKGDTGAQGPQGEQGIQGETGAAGVDGTLWLTGSAAPIDAQGKNGDLYLNITTYDIYLKSNGGWISIGNIKGPQGPQGETGVAGTTPTVDINDDGYWVINGVPTNQKAQGEAGATPTITIESGNWYVNGEDTGVKAEAIDGTKGADGNTWAVGDEAPAVANENDMFLNNTTWEVYKYNGTTWVSVGNIKGETGSTGATGSQGPQGETGAAGADGATWLSGTGEPDAGIGVEGDLYLDTESCNVYIKGTSGWAVAVNIKGEQGETGETGSTGATGEQGAQGAAGADGATWLHGTTVPNIANGNNGDFYLDTVNYNIYVKSANAWELLCNIKGADGTGSGSGTTPTIEINSDGYWVINGETTNIYAGDEINFNIKGDVLVSDPLEVADFAGKRITILGDSITYGVGATTTATSYASLVATQLGVNLENLGQSGTTFCEGVVESNGSPTNSRLSSVKSYNGTTDYFIVALGTNDWTRCENGNRINLGYLGSDNVNTIYGAVNVYAKTLVEKFEGTNTKIYFSTPIISNKIVGTYDGNAENKVGYSLRDLCNAIIETCEMYDIPVLDMNLASGITATEMKDGIHPNDAGHALMADTMVEFLLANYSYVDISQTKTVTLVNSIKTRQFVKTGSNFTLPTLEDTSAQTFKHWTSGSDTYTGGQKVTITDNQTFTAVFEDKEDTGDTGDTGSGDEVTDPEVTEVALNLVYSTGETVDNALTIDKGTATTQDALEEVVSNSYGLVPSFYSDENYTQALDYSATYNENTTIYVYWETDPAWFMVDNGVIVNKSSLFPSSGNSIEKLILLRFDSDGNKITGLQETTNMSFYFGTEFFTTLSEIRVPEGYTKIAGRFVFTQNTSINVMDNNKAKIYLPSTLTAIDDDTFL
ncbi:MAG: hypothetical protein IJW25_01990, partial [Clostridia bacterium]|nr:hypothetical protein [Clostridia bacterium]